MDNQNANGGFSPNPNNFPGQFGSYDPNAGQKSGEQPAENTASSADANTPNTQPKDAADFIVRPLENVRTRSLVESPREVSAEELAKAQAYQQELARQERVYKTKKRAEKTGVYVGLGIFGIIFVVAIIFVVVGVLGGGYGFGNNIRGGESEEDKKLSVIDGYQCTTAKCQRMDDLPDGRILLRDNEYFIYNKASGETTLTTIENQDYNSIKSFSWGGKIYAIVYPTTEKKGLFSIDENRLVVDYAYDEFYTEASNSAYNEMTWAEGKYIIARKDSPVEYSALDLSTGQSVLRASSRVFIHDGFFIALNSDGSRLVYRAGEGSAFLVLESTEKLYTRDGVLVRVEADGGLTYYNTAGEEVYDDNVGFADSLDEYDSDQIPSIIARDNRFYSIPGN